MTEKVGENLGSGPCSPHLSEEALGPWLTHILQDSQVLLSPPRPTPSCPPPQDRGGGRVGRQKAILGWERRVFRKGDCLSQRLNIG